jgi:urea transport system ATP-binding protein
MVTAPLPLCIEGLSVALGGAPVLTGLDLTVPPASACFLLGPNGAGKTTLLNAISGLVPVQSGAVRVGAANLNRMSPSRRARHFVSRSFQHPVLSAELTCRQHALLATAPRRSAWVFLGGHRAGHESQDQAAAILEAIGLAAHADRPVRHLTHAKRKLLSVALSLGSGVPVLLLDEPAAGLDSAEKAFLARRLAGQGHGRTILMVEHDMEFIALMDLPVHFLLAGRIAHTGSIADIRAYAASRSVYF